MGNFSVFSIIYIRLGGATSSFFVTLGKIMGLETYVGDTQVGTRMTGFACGQINNGLRYGDQRQLTIKQVARFFLVHIKICALS